MGEPSHHPPTLSVLIATYNRARLLDRALCSLLDEAAESPDEIVVVNGGHDCTGDVVASYIARGAPIHLVEVENVGLSHSQNSGYPYCCGDIVATLDDDVVVAPDWARRVRAAHVTHAHAGGIGGRVLNEFPDALVARFEQARSFMVAGEGVRPVRTVAGVAMTYKRAVMEQVGPFDESLPAGMDVDYNWRVARLGYQILYDPAIVLTHHNRRSVRGMLRQQFWYGRGYFRTRRKWPDLPSSRIPRGLRGRKNWVKLALFVADPFLYQPYDLAHRGAAPGDRLPFAALACAADLSMKAGFLYEAFRS